jgi:hypothetical protein
MNYYVFLDIDGVFTSNRVNEAHTAEYKMWHRFDPVAISFMNWVHDTYPVEFVLMTTWKDGIDIDHGMSLHWVKSAFGNSGFRGKFADNWKTDPNNKWVNKYGRGQEVSEYLRVNHADDYILFDDNEFDFKKVLGKNRLVKTDSQNGLLHKHMLNAKSIMGSWEKK